MSNASSNIAGSLLIGLTVSLYMYGVITTQTCYYFLHYCTDSLKLKLRVCFLWTISTAFIILLSASVYEEVVVRGRTGNPDLVTSWTIPLYTTFVISLAIVALVQTDFMFKCHKLNTRKWRLVLTCLLGCAILVRFASGVVALRVLGMEMSSPPEITPGIKTDSLFRRATVLVFFTSTLISEILITAFLCILYRPANIISRSTHYLVVRLTMFALRRCIMVFIISTTELVFLLVPSYQGTQASFFGMEATVGSVYVLNFLTNLNARRTLKARSIEASAVPDSVIEMDPNIWDTGQGSSSAPPSPRRTTGGGIAFRSYSESKLAWYELIWGGW